MRNRSMLLKSFIFVGNIVLVVTIITSSNVIPSSKKVTVSTKSEYPYLETRLIDRGLEKDVAQKLTKKVKISQEAVYILSKELNISKDKVYDKILDRTLRGEYVDLTSKSTLITLAQSLSGGFISQNTLNAIHNYQI